MQYTIQTIDSGVFQLTSTTDNTQIKIDKEHPKFRVVNKAASSSDLKLINVNGSGRWTSTKDYNNVYGTKGSKTSTPAKPVNVQLEKLDDLNIDDSLFEAMETGTIFDKFCSSEGGIQRGTNLMACGAPGIGKTTVLLELLSKLHEAGRRVLFISAEMNQIDMARYLKRFPNWGQLPILFLGDYSDSDPKSVIEQTINQGWDLILTDSYTEVNDTVKEESNMTRGKVEKWFLNLMSENNKGKNKKKLYTTFITILQMSKGGTFVGSNKLKHMTTSMITLDWDGAENSGKRYMEFTKNRVGQVNKKMYFDLTDGVTFDEGRYARDLFNDVIIDEEKKQLETEDGAFDRLFGFNQIEEVEEIKESVELA